jgi:hypothetical protein
MQPSDNPALKEVARVALQIRPRGRSKCDQTRAARKVAGIKLAHHVLGHGQVRDCKYLQFHLRQQVVARVSRLAVEHRHQLLAALAALCFEPSADRARVLRRLVVVLLGSHEALRSLSPPDICACVERRPSAGGLRQLEIMQLCQLAFLVQRWTSFSCRDS